MTAFIETITYIHVDVADDGRIALAAISDDPSARDILHALVFVRATDGSWSGCQLNNRLVGIHLSQPGESFDAMGIAIDGGVCLITGSGQDWSLIEEGAEGPNTLVPLIVSRRIGGSIVATGMQRRVYAGAASAWSRVDNGVRILADDVAIGGFLSIDGTSPEQLWAAGYYGEIWHCDKSRWSRIDSPTNMKLIALRQQDDGSVIVAGDNGIVFIREHAAGGWQRVDGLDSYAAIAIEVFQSQTYIAVRGGALYVLRPDGLQRVEGCGSFPVYAMRACATSLLAVGPFGLLMLDAGGWREVLPPVPVESV
jgi:hypothetical protein